MPASLRMRIVDKVTSEKVAWWLAALFAVVMLFTFYLYRRALLAVYYVPGADRLTVARADAFAVPPHDVARWAQHVVTNLEGFTPETVEAQMSYVRKLMGRAALAEDPTVLTDIAAYAKSGEITSAVQIVPDTTEVRELRDRWEVSFDVVKAEYTRDKLFRRLHLRCVVTVVPGVVSVETPDGLLVARYVHQSSPIQETKPDP